MFAKQPDEIVESYAHLADRIYALYLAGAFKRDIPLAVGLPYNRATFQFIDLVISQRPVIPVQQWELEAFQRTISYLRSEKLKS